MDIIKVKGATGKSDTDIGGKLRAAKRILKKYDFVYCHIKATDNFAHDGDYQGKKKFIEKFDRYLPILFDSSKTTVIITGDHTTPCELKEHSSDPVPVLLCSLPVIPEKIVKKIKFGERACQQGGLGKIKQLAFLKEIVKMGL